MMESNIVNYRLTISSATKLKVEKMYKVEKQLRRKDKGPRHFFRTKTKKLNRNNVREQLSNAHQQHAVHKEATIKYNLVNSVNLTLALFYSKKIF